MWSNFRKRAESSGGGANFLKLKDGQRANGVFRGETYDFFQVYGDKSNTEYQNQIPGSSWKFKINFIMKENEAMVAKIISQGKTFATDMIAAMEEAGRNYAEDNNVDLSGLSGEALEEKYIELGKDNWGFTIARKGSTKEDTKYTIIPSRIISEAARKQIDAVELLNLRKKDKQAGDNGPLEEGVVEDEEIPF